MRGFVKKLQTWGMQSGQIVHPSFWYQRRSSLFQEYISWDFPNKPWECLHSKRCLKKNKQCRILLQWKNKVTKSDRKKNKSKGNYLCFCWHRYRRSPLPVLFCVQTDPKGWAQPCAFHLVQQCGTGHTSGQMPSCLSRYLQAWFLKMDGGKHFFFFIFSNINTTTTILVQ